MWLITHDYNVADDTLLHVADDTRSNPDKIVKLKVSAAIYEFY